jgi:hypothetical protein
VLLSIVGLTGCIPGRSDDADAGKLIAWPADDRWPEELLALAPEIQEAYRYAVGNPDVLQYMPCFCGCGETSGHTSNKDCYIEEFRSNGSVVLDQMSFG